MRLREGEQVATLAPVVGSEDEGLPPEPTEPGADEPDQDAGSQ